MCIFFFFKQKTAYEMRISDWSSDVCSSDLKLIGARRDMRDNLIQGRRQLRLATRRPFFEVLPAIAFISDAFRPNGINVVKVSANAPLYGAPLESRSEEHTSELQSLMRISYAVFCLKKTKHHTITHYL